MQVEEDLRNGVVGAVPVAPSDAGKEEVISSLVANVESMIKADRKITSLKQLQVPSNIPSQSWKPKSFTFMEFCSKGNSRVIYGGLDLKAKNCKELFLRMFLRH
jgi:hypothetical protein